MNKHIKAILTLTMVVTIAGIAAFAALLAVTDGNSLVALFGTGGLFVPVFFGVVDGTYLRDGTSNLTATETGTGAAVGPIDLDGVDIYVSVPQATGTSPTMDIVIQESDTLGSGYTPLVTFDQITAAGVYRRKVVSVRKYLRHVATIAGTTPNFGKVLIGLQSGGQYTDKQSQ